jgi:hypothetical protein
MSKLQKSGLTPSRKKRVRRRRPFRLDVGILDGLLDRCSRLDMMAELLMVCGEPLEPGVMQRLGYWASQELKALQELLAELGKGTR